MRLRVTRPPPCPTPTIMRSVLPRKEERDSKFEMPAPSCPSSPTRARSGSLQVEER